MATIQATNIGGRIIPDAKWEVPDISKLSAGDPVRVSIPFKDAKLERYLKSQELPACTMEREERGVSVTLGLVTEKFTHMLDTEPSNTRLDSMAWVKPMNRTVEAVLTYLFDRENCEPRFLAAVGVKRASAAPEA